MKITKKDLIVGKRLGDYIVTDYAPENDEEDGIFGIVRYQCLVNIKTGKTKYVSIPIGDNNTKIIFDEYN